MNAPGESEEAQRSFCGIAAHHGGGQEMRRTFPSSVGDEMDDGGTVVVVVGKMVDAQPLPPKRLSLSTTCHERLPPLSSLLSLEVQPVLAFVVDLKPLSSSLSSLSSYSSSSS